MSLERLNPFNWNIRSHFRPYTIEGTGEAGKVEISKIPYKVSEEESILFVTAQLKITETGKVFELWLKGKDQVSIREVTDAVQVFTLETEEDETTPKEFIKVENVIVIDAKNFSKCAEVAVGSDSKVVEAFKTLLQQNQSYRVTNAARSLKQRASSISVPACLKSKWVTTPLKMTAFTAAAVASGYALTHFDIISGPIKYACNFAASTAPEIQKGYGQLGYEAIARTTGSVVSSTSNALSYLKFW